MTNENNLPMCEPEIAGTDLTILEKDITSVMSKLEDLLRFSENITTQIVGTDVPVACMTREERPHEKNRVCELSKKTKELAGLIGSVNRELITIQEIVGKNK